MTQINNADLTNLLSGIKPSIVTPHLNDIVQIKTNEKKLRHVSHLLVQSMVDTFNASEQATIPRMIMHEGKAMEVRRFNVEPLLSGVWPAMSLMLLQLSYGEQTTLIDALYPKATQFTAKCFATVFTVNTGTTDIKVQSDNTVETKLDSANAGIAMILAMMGEQGFRTPHPDRIVDKQKDIHTLVTEAAKSEAFKNATQRAKSASAFQDAERTL